MIAYSIEYTLKKDGYKRFALIDAKDIKSAKNKIGRKHGYKDGRNIILIKSVIIGYF